MVMDLRIHPDSVYLLHAPMFFGAGGGGRLTTVLRGCKTIIMQYEVNAVLEAIERERITHFTMSPTPIKRIVDHPDVNNAYRGLQKIRKHYRKGQVPYRPQQHSIQREVFNKLETQKSLTQHATSSISAILGPPSFERAPARTKEGTSANRARMERKRGSVKTKGHRRVRARGYTPRGAPRA